MTIWEKTILNIQKGLKKIAAAAAVLSERVNAEIAIVRLRIRADEVQSQIDELHRVIGREVERLRNSEELSQALEPLLRNEQVDASLNELVERKKELEDLKQDIISEQDAFRKVKQQTEDVAV